MVTILGDLETEFTHWRYDVMIALNFLKEQHRHELTRVQSQRKLNYKVRYRKSVAFRILSWGSNWFCLLRRQHEQGAIHVGVSAAGIFQYLLEYELQPSGNGNKQWNQVHTSGGPWKANSTSRYSSSAASSSPRNQSTLLATSGTQSFFNTASENDSFSHQSLRS